VSLHLGLDLGGTNVKCAVLEGERVLAQATAPTRSAGGPEDVLARVAELARATAAPHGPIATAGLGLPGHFDPASGTGGLLPNLAGDWEGRPIAGPLGAALGVPVRLVNDVRAMTLAELRLGAGRGADDLICVALGTGVGGGVAIGGRLHLGLGHAGEIGHTTVVPDGPRCGCGNRGCLDRVAAASAIAADARVATVEQAVAAAEAGDRRAIGALAAAGRHVGLALAGAIVLLWPQRVVVGGGVAAAGELLLGPLREEVRTRAQVAPVEEIAIVPAQLGPGAGAIGAALWGAGAGQMRSPTSSPSAASNPS
jgi:glucokinase